jgi:hypothetical protein
MRNKFGGDCYKCGLWVAPGTGHFERFRGKWRTQHALHKGHGAVTCAMAADKAVEEEAAKNQIEANQFGCVS